MPIDEKKIIEIIHTPPPDIFPNRQKKTKCVVKPENAGHPATKVALVGNKCPSCILKSYFSYKVNKQLAVEGRFSVAISRSINEQSKRRGSFRKHQRKTIKISKWRMFFSLVGDVAHI